MKCLDAALVFAGALMFASCDDKGQVRSSPIPTRIVGNVDSVSSADIRTALDLELQAITKELGSAPPHITIRVIDRDHIDFEFSFHDSPYGDGAERVKGQWQLFTGPRAIIQSGPSS